MKIALIFLLSITLHGAFSVKYIKSAKSTSVRRPASFATDVQNLLKDMASANGYTGRFDRCHVVPWKFIGHMIEEYAKGKLAKTRMITFVNDLARIHYGAAYYDVLSKATQKSLRDMTSDYKAGALAAVGTRNMKELAKMLYNMPSNLYPGDPTNNRSIQNNLDPPKEESGTGGRSQDAVPSAVTLLTKYSRNGLTAKDDPSAPGRRVKSSDKPPGDTTGDYVNI